MYLTGVFENFILFLFCVVVVVFMNKFFEKVIDDGFCAVIFLKVCLNLFRICVWSWSCVIFMALLRNHVTLLLLWEIGCSGMKLRYISECVTLIC